jgi:hypothetical protein
LLSNMRSGAANIKNMSMQPQPASRHQRHLLHNSCHGMQHVHACVNTCQILCFLSFPNASLDAQSLQNSRTKLFSTAQVYSVTCAFHGGQCCAGWAPGIISLFLGFGVTFWTSRIIASFHEYGGKRNIRYRDLASSVLGEQRIYVTVKKRLHH